MCNFSWSTWLMKRDFPSIAFYIVTNRMPEWAYVCVCLCDTLATYCNPFNHDEKSMYTPNWNCLINMWASLLSACVVLAPFLHLIPLPLLQARPYHRHGALKIFEPQWSQLQHGKQKVSASSLAMNYSRGNTTSSILLYKATIKNIFCIYPRPPTVTEAKINNVFSY